MDLQTADIVETGIDSRFTGSFLNKIDAKGRVSVPADFRRSLTGPDGMMVFCCPALDDVMLVCGGADLIDTLIGIYSNEDHFSENRQLLEYTITAETRQLPVDHNGRIILSPDLQKIGGLSGQAMFVGYANRFLVRAPESHTSLIERARAVAMAGKETAAARGLPSVSARKRGGNDG